jgi:hypothetical protein
MSLNLFNRSFVIRLALMMLAGFAVYRLWPNDIRAVEKNTRKLLAAVSKEGPESLPVSAAKSLEAGSYLASNVVLRLGEPFPGQVRKSEAISMLQQARMQADRLTVGSRGHQISKTRDSEIVMDITLEADAAAGDRKEEIINSYRLTWGKNGGEWKITRAEVIDVIRHPSGELQPF